MTVMTAIGKTCLSIFFNFDNLSSINNDGDNTGYPHGNTVKEKNASFDHDLHFICSNMNKVL